MGVPELVTDRLILRQLQLEDAEQTQQLFPQWEVVKFLTAAVPWPYPEDGAFKSIGIFHSLRLKAVTSGTGRCDLKGRRSS